MGLFSCQAGAEPLQPGNASSGHLNTTGSNAMVLQGNKHLLLASPTFAHAPMLETPMGCCWSYSRAKQFLLG